MLSNMFFLHMLRCSGHKFGDQQYKKSVGLIYGPTGCGKTYLVETLAKITGLPYMKLAAKSITNSGYKGKNLEEHLKDYINNNSDNPNLDYGIIHIDEYDKLCIPSGSEKSWNDSLQMNLLNFIEGQEFNIGRSTFSSRNLFIILTGSFSHLKSERAAEDKSLATGFAASKKVQDKKTVQQLLIDGGMIREVVGRVSYISKVEKLTLEQAKDAFLNKKDSIYSQYQELLKTFVGDKAKLSDERVDELIKNCIDSNIGIRGLHYALERELQEIIFSIDSNGKPELAIIDQPLHVEDDEGDEYEQ